MKKKSTLFTKALIISNLFIGSLSAQSIPEVLYYKFDGTGTKVPNYASAKPVGTDTANILGGITQGAGSAGLCSGSLIGSGAASSSDYLNTGWTTNLGTGAWTISFRSAGISVSSTLFYVFGDGNAASFRCFTNGVAGANNFILRGGGLVDVLANGAAQTTATMTTFVYDSTLNNVKAYINGVLVNTVVQTALSITGTGPFKVMGYNSNVGAPAGGQMDEFRVYSRALTAAEVATLYNPLSGISFLGPNITSCSGSATISPNVPTGNPMWSNGATTSSITVTTSGTYTFKDSSTCAVGKDTISVVIGNNTSASQTIKLCAGQSYNINGNTYNATGIYNDTLTSAEGCDSIIITNLTVASLITASQTITLCAGQSYTFNGNTYTASGLYSDTLTAVNGCDSIVTTNLTVSPQITLSQIITRCAGQSYTFNGNTYTASGTYSDTLTAANGCDSIVTTNLTVSPLIIISQTITKCFGQTYTVGSNTYNSNGVYTDTVIVAGACDNIIITNLTINPAITSSQSISICAGQSYSINGNTYNTSGIYLDTLTAVNTCDSIVTTNLLVKPAINISTTTNNLTITANAINATYQWINCTTNTNIGGATNQSYTATANGNYAVIVTQNGCSDTSACVSITNVSITKIAANNKISIYPNPNNGVFTIATDFNTEINIYDALGREVMKQNINAGKTTIDLSKEMTGVYYIKMKNAQSQMTKRIVVTK
jgi:Secretion system C-terminal sorting domain/Concanavalin A-like lectin/glucanases superfamily